MAPPSGTPLGLPTISSALLSGRPPPRGRAAASPGVRCPGSARPSRGRQRPCPCAVASGVALTGVHPGQGGPHLRDGVLEGDCFFQRRGRLGVAPEVNPPSLDRGR